LNVSAEYHQNRLVSIIFSYIVSKLVHPCTNYHNVFTTLMADFWNAS